MYCAPISVILGMHFTRVHASGSGASGADDHFMSSVAFAAYRDRTDHTKRWSSSTAPQERKLSQVHTQFRQYRELTGHWLWWCETSSSEIQRIKRHPELGFIRENLSRG